ncbi:MAG: branched-chain amino acid ABC transporter permease [Comamonas sp.]|uniref:branched-chain amino acid ABC transporter permease n=1 Tax=Comamonas sp. TaxID=34028 RepID=UPI003D10C01A
MTDTTAPRPAAAQATPAAQPSVFDHRLRPRLALPLLALLIAFPLIAQAMGEDFYIGVASRVLVFGLAAASLNFILGFGGMVSFGHAAFVGLGAYAVGLLMQQGVTSAWLAWPLAMLMGAAFSLLVGAISLRTQGVYFIMITLAFAQMLYYLIMSFKSLGGDDGMSLPGRSEMGLGLDLAQDATFYYVVLALVSTSLLLMARVLNARFGHVLQAIKENETRMQAIGFPVYRYKLVAFTLAGAFAGLAGAMLANQGSFVGPGMLQWTQSGILLIMVILGGVGHLYGGLVGAAVFLLLEEVLAAYTVHWQLGLGAVLLIVVLVAPNGLLSLRRGMWSKR